MPGVNRTSAGCRRGSAAGGAAAGPTGWAGEGGAAHNRGQFFSGYPPLRLPKGASPLAPKIFQPWITRIVPNHGQQWGPGAGVNSREAGGAPPLVGASGRALGPRVGSGEAPEVTRPDLDEDGQHHLDGCITDWFVEQFVD